MKKCLVIICSLLVCTIISAKGEDSTYVSCKKKDSTHFSCKSEDSTYVSCKKKDSTHFSCQGEDLTLVSYNIKEDCTTLYNSQVAIFEGFRPLYLTSGFPLSEKISAENADVKFQLSFKLNILTKKKLNLFVGYTQLSLWNLYAKSSPFYDNTYIPGIYLNFPFYRNDGSLSYSVLCGYEHKSNGRNDEFSRSINYLFASYRHYFRNGIELDALLRLGTGYYQDDHSMLMYNAFMGYVDLGMRYTSPKKNFDIQMQVTPLFNKYIANTTAEIAYQLGRRKCVSLFTQYHYGFDEAFRDCFIGQSPRHFLRFGIRIEP